MPADSRPSTTGFTRRQLFIGAAGVAVTALAGCAAQASSSEADCILTAVENGEGDVLTGVTTLLQDGNIILVVGLEESEITSVDRVLISNSAGDLLYEIPTTDAQEYRIQIGQRPSHGRFHLSVQNDQTGEIDSLVVEFNCPAESQ